MHNTHPTRIDIVHCSLSLYSTMWRGPETRLGSHSSTVSSQSTHSARSRLFDSSCPTPSQAFHPPPPPPSGVAPPDFDEDFPPPPSFAPYQGDTDGFYTATGKPSRRTCLTAILYATFTYILSLSSCMVFAMRASSGWPLVAWDGAADA